MDQTFVDCEGLRDGFCAIIAALIIGEMQTFERAVFALQILRNRLTPLERNLVCIQVQNFEGGIFEQVLHYDVDSVVAQKMLLNGQLLQTHVVLEHFAEMDSHRLTDGLVDGIVQIELFKGVI